VIVGGGGRRGREIQSNKGQWQSDAAFKFFLARSS